MAADDTLNWCQHSQCSPTSLFIPIILLFFIASESTEYPVIDEEFYVKLYPWYAGYGRMMRAQTDIDGPNALQTSKYKVDLLDDTFGDDAQSLDDEGIAEDYVNEDKMAIPPTRNGSLLSRPAFSTDLNPLGDELVPLNSNTSDDWWTLCQLPVFIVLFAVIGVLAVTFVVLIWLKSQMIESEKEKSSKGTEGERKILCPCPTHGNAADDRWVFHTVINLNCGAEEKGAVAVQPQESTHIGDEPVAKRTSPQVPAAAVSTAGTPEKRPEAVRIKAKGLLERRGSNVSLTIDLPQTNNETPAHIITPTRECSAEEFLLSAGNVLCRAQLRTCLKDTGSLHREFWDIPLNHTEENQVTGCSGKNRYRSILPNERSRVLLDNEDEPYINANYIRGCDGEDKVYIATQGPLGNTITDLYSMIWSNRCPIIVMMTHLVEKTKPKCEPYFPLGLNESATFGEFEVTVEELIPRQGYVLRHLIVRHKGEARRILHYWYDTWPDHKTPVSAHAIVEMSTEIEKIRTNMKNIKSPNNNDSVCNGPIVVHCSAGIGRTGCFIAISLAVCQLLEENKVDILGIVCQLRYDRGGMVQTAEQYEFVHRAVALFESTLPDTTPTSKDSPLPLYLSSLN